MPWHGYERLLEGLANYYHKGGISNIVIYMVGDGRELHEKAAEYLDLNNAFSEVIDYINND